MLPQVISANKEVYTSPEVKVFKVKVQKMICASPGGSTPATMGWGEDDGSNWN